MLPPDRAWQRLIAHLAPLPPASVDCRHGHGRVLAEAVVATTDLPATDVSAMDGYALAGAAEAGARLPVTGTVAAGDPPGAQLAPGAALRIMTGGTVPDGADRVVPIEATDGSEQTVRIDRPPAPGAHIRRRGEVVRRGDTLLAPGLTLMPQALALLATQGVETVTVHARPRVAFLSTGNEVVPAESEPGPGQLRDSHSAFLAAECAALGVPFTHLGIAPDDPENLRLSLRAALAAERLREAPGNAAPGSAAERQTERLREAPGNTAPGSAAERQIDVLLISGGVSKGAFDYVPSILAELGCETLFHGVAMQPGKPLLAAHHGYDGGGALVFGLPGNPASVMSSFWLFVRPALRLLGGHAEAPWMSSLTAKLNAPLPSATDRDRFFPARLAVRDGQFHVEPLLTKGSHDLTTWSLTQALVRVRAGDTARAAGEECEILLIDR